MDDNLDNKLQRSRDFSREVVRRPAYPRKKSLFESDGREHGSSDEHIARRTTPWLTKTDRNEDIYLGVFPGNCGSSCLYVDSGGEQKLVGIVTIEGYSLKTS